MPVADLVNVPSTPAEWSWFSFAHFDHHQRVNAYIRSSSGVLLPLYVLDPIDTSPNTAWGYNHQTMHNNNDAVLQVAGFDITEVDWTDADQVSSWIWLHYKLHYAEATASGVW